MFTSLWHSTDFNLEKLTRSTTHEDLGSLVAGTCFGGRFQFAVAVARSADNGSGHRSSTHLLNFIHYNVLLLSWRRWKRFKR